MRSKVEIRDVVVEKEIDLTKWSLNKLVVGLNNRMIMRRTIQRPQIEGEFERSGKMGQV